MVGKETRINKGKLLSVAGMLGLVAVLPALLTDDYYLSVMVIIGINTLLVIGLGLLMGFAGQISLGHAAFYGLGAYGSAIFTTHYQLNPWLSMLLAAVITAIIAYIIGRPTLRLKEHYLALATIGFGVVIHILFMEGGELTGGPSGLMGIPPLSMAGLTVDTDLKFYYLIWAMVLLGMIVSHNIVHSRIGRALKAIHGSEVAAEAMGIDTAKFKLQTFVVSAIYASIAGSLYAHYVRFISPSPFGLNTSIEIVLMVVVGGLVSIWGPILGSALIISLVEFLREMVPRIYPEAGGEFELISYGLILVLVMIFLPDGLTSLKSKIIKPRVVAEEKKASPLLSQGIRVESQTD